MAKQSEKLRKGEFWRVLLCYDGDENPVAWKNFRNLEKALVFATTQRLRGWKVEIVRRDSSEFNFKNEPSIPDSAVR